MTLIDRLLVGDAEAVTEDVIVAGVSERTPHPVARGRGALAALLAPGAVEVMLAAGDGDDLLVEGRTASATIAASLQLVRGQVARALVFETRPVDPPSPPGASSSDPRTLLETYLQRLESGDVAGAAACFSLHALYSHPPYAADGERVDVRGREALEALFRERGSRPWHHRLIVSVRRGGDCLVEGDVEGLGSFVSTVSLDEDGRIARYVSFYTEPAVPRL